MAGSYGWCSCDRDPPSACFYHGCPGCNETAESAAAKGLVTGHGAGCKYRPRLETEVL